MFARGKNSQDAVPLSDNGEGANVPLSAMDSASGARANGAIGDREWQWR
jgi:hypothetical protein